MMEIELIGGYKTLIDDEDYEWLIKDFVWVLFCCKSKKYAIGIRKVIDSEHPNQSFRIHRLIMKKHFGESKLGVDHINGDGLDNRKINLRYATQSQNCMNRKVLLNKKYSKYKGISYQTDSKTWITKIKLNGKHIIGICFDNEIDAAIAYDILANNFFGEFACTNNIKTTSEHIERIKMRIKNKKILIKNSKYRGVSLKHGKWQSYIKCNKIIKRIGGFKYEREAAIAYDIEIKKLNKNIELNIPDATIQEILLVQSIVDNPKKCQGKSKYLGVYKKGNKWASQIRFCGKQIYLGSFNTEVEAAVVFNNKSKELFINNLKLNII